jgi:ribosomal protein L24
MLMINCISCNYLIKQSNNKKKPPIARGIHIQNISMTKGKKCEKQEKDKKVKKRKEKQDKTKNKKRN